MNKPLCNITRKYAKKSAAKVIQRFVRKRSTAARSERKKVFSKMVKGRRLSRFMKNVDKIKLRSVYLNAVCSDAGVCIVFGKEINKIHAFFDHFVNFNYLKDPVKLVGKISNNGFVKLLHYERAGYSANAILKSSAKPDSDNLFYEYLVGLYINKQCGRFPCFVETYGAFHYLSESAYLHVKENAENKADIIKSALSPMTKSQFKKSCVAPEFCSILVQHIKDAPSIADKCQDAEFVIHDLLYVLFQVYMPLAKLKDEFTHYDLHLDNVLVYEPVKDNYIEYHYHMEDGVVITFKSKYIAKIIDYGRSFFVDNENDSVTGSSMRIYRKLCAEAGCIPACGYNYGYSWLAPNLPNPLNNYYISSQVKNISHDLRLLDMLSRTSKTPDFKRAVKMVASKNQMLHTLVKKVKYEMKYGTRENLNTKSSKSAILNIEDAKNALRDMILQVSNMQDNDLTYMYKKRLGDMHVYSDGRLLEYISA
jgi:hypothetical protein